MAFAMRRIPKTCWRRQKRTSIRKLLTRYFLRRNADLKDSDPDERKIYGSDRILSTAGIGGFSGRISTSGAPSADRETGSVRSRHQGKTFQSISADLKKPQTAAMMRRRRRFHGNVLSASAAAIMASSRDVNRRDGLV